MSKSEVGKNEAPEPSHVVGIGASAGGLEAIDAFFSNMPTKNDYAFVVIQHLSPDHKSLMVEILSKKTEMPVNRAEDSMKVRPGEIYLIPPKKNLVLFHGKLLLRDQEPTRGLNLPIDVFFRSLAEDQEEKAVAIILSGTGSDGMRGVRAVKHAGGMIMAQAPESAQFDGMPRAAISTGMADFVLPPDQMPAQLVAFTEHPHVVSGDLPSPLSADEDGMAKIFALLRERCKVDFTNYKPSTVLRRVDRRMTINQLESTADYYAYLQQVSSEVTTLFRELLIGVTNFFRDPWVFEIVQTEIIPELIEKSGGRELRVWVSACSTGEEAYTIAMLIKNGLEELGVHRNVKIFATDIDRGALQFAAAGSYPESVAADIPVQFLSKYFVRKEEHFQISRTIREMVVFAQHNIIKDPPFTSMDLISCRNVLIYLQPVLQNKVLQFFQFSLRQGGVLLLGTSETTGEFGKNLEPLNAKAKIFRSKSKLPTVPSSPEGLSAGDTRFRELSRQAASMRAEPRRGNDQLFDRFMEAVSPRFLPAGIIVNEHQEVVHVLGESSPYIRFPSGRPTLALDRIVVKELAIPIVTGVQKAFREGEQVRFTGVKVPGEAGVTMLNLTILMLPGKGGQDPLAAVLMEEENPTPDGSPGSTANYDLSDVAEQRIADLEQELQFSKENLQATIEELETANEELQATNEELLASNEELQSTNEELQSTNEELFTVNTEYNQKIIELSELNNDVQNLFENRAIGLLILDENLEVRRFSSGVRGFLQIEETDVGRPVHRIVSRLPDFDLYGSLAAQTSQASSAEWEVCNEEGEWYLLRVSPYSISPDETSGLIVYSVEVTDRKEAQAALDAQLGSHRFISELSSTLLQAPLDEFQEALSRPLAGIAKEFGARSAELCEVSAEDQPAAGTKLIPLSPREKPGETAMEALRLVFAEGSVPANGESELELKTVTEILTVAMERARVYRQLKEEEERYRLLVESSDAIPWEYSIPEDSWTYVAPQVEESLGYTPEEWTDYQFWLARLHPVDRDWASNYCATATERGESHVFEYRFETKSGEYVWIRDLVTVEMGEEKPVRLRGFMIDITDRHLSEERIKSLLQEKELLLRELSHRVKNNLSTLSSLLSLQADATENSAAASALTDARDRVDTLNLVHELLETDEVVASTVDLGEYLSHLAHRVVDAALLNPNVTLETDFCSLQVSKEKATPIGMVANELLTNAVKHAFPDNREGRVTASLECSESEAVLTIRDDGVGFGPELNDGTHGLGLNLVRTVCSQFGGSVTLDTDSGTTATIQFPLSGG